MGSSANIIVCLFQIYKHAGCVSLRSLRVSGDAVSSMTWRGCLGRNDCMSQHHPHLPALAATTSLKTNASATCTSVPPYKVEFYTFLFSQLLLCACRCVCVRACVCVIITSSSFSFSNHVRDESVCVCACARACMSACLCVCVCVRARARVRKCMYCCCCCYILIVHFG